MRSLKTLAFAGAVFAGATAVASAADLRGPAPPIGLPPPPMAAPIAEASGWYLRGDIGVGQLGGKTEIKQAGVGPSRGLQEDFGSFVNGGLGAGYQLNSWFRFDVTGEYRTKTAVKFKDKYCNDVGPAPGFATLAATCSGTAPFQREGFNNISGNISSTLFLANAYVDLGTWSGITPFVGVGLGFANHKMTGFQDVGGNFSRNMATGQPVAGTSFTTGGYLGNSSKTNFAWAAMAGLGYDVNERLKLELGYRYLNMGSITSGASVCAGVPCDFTVRAKNLDSHELKLGMRWMLGGPSYAAAPAVPMGYPEPRVVKKF